MKIKSVCANNKKREFSIINRAGSELSFPYHKAEPAIHRQDRVLKAYVDRELAHEGSTFTLDSGDQGSVHIEQVLDFNKDPTYLANLLLYKLTIQCIERIDHSGFSRRQLAKRLNTSVPQLYRLLDPANSSKSMKQLISLLTILDCEVDLVVR